MLTNDLAHILIDHRFDQLRHILNMIMNGISVGPAVVHNVADCGMSAIFIQKFNCGLLNRFFDTFHV